MSKFIKYSFFIAFILFLAEISNARNHFIYALSPSGKLAACMVNQENGKIENCKRVNYAADRLGANAITVNPVTHKVYIVYNISGTEVCTVNNETGDFTACSRGPNPNVLPKGIAFNSTGTIAYITDSNPSHHGRSVLACDVTYDEPLPSNCRPVGVAFNHPTGIVIAGDAIAFITEQVQGTIKTCQILQDGMFGKCYSPEGKTHNLPYGIAVDSDVTKIFISDFNSEYPANSCKVSAMGSIEFAQCNHYYIDKNEGSTSVVLDLNDKYAYFSTRDSKVNSMIYIMQIKNGQFISHYTINKEIIIGGPLLAYY